MSPLPAAVELLLAAPASWALSPASSALVSPSAAGFSASPARGRGRPAAAVNISMLRRAISANGLAGEGAGHGVAELALVALQRVQRRLEILRHHRLHRVAVHRDQLPQEIDRQHRRAARFLLHDDLGEDRAGDVVAALGVDDFELALLADHLGEPLERDVGRAFGIVEPPVRIFLDDDHIVIGPRTPPCQSSSRSGGIEPSTKACRTATTGRGRCPLFLDFAAQRNRSKSGADEARALPACAATRRRERPPPPAPMPAIAEAQGAALRDYGGSGPAGRCSSPR